MTDVIAAIVALIGVGIVLSAAMLLGAVLAVLRPEHRNPIAYRWVRWYAHHSRTRHDRT